MKPYEPRHVCESTAVSPDKEPDMKRVVAAAALVAVAMAGAAAATSSVHEHVAPETALPAAAPAAGEPFAAAFDSWFDRDLTAPEPKPAADNILSVTTWNTMYDNLKNVGVEARRVMRDNDSDVLVLQEVHRRDQQDGLEDKLCALTYQYGCYMASYDRTNKSRSDRSSESSYPVIWRKETVERVGKGSDYKMTDAYVNKAGDRISARYAIVVLLRDKATDEEFYVINTHWPSSVEDGGQPRTDSPAFDHYTEQAKALARLLLELMSTGKSVILAGDFNVNADRDTGTEPSFPSAWSHTAGLVNDRSQGETGGLDYSHIRKNGEKVLIDYIFTNGRLEPRKQIISPERHGSDHFPVTSQLAHVPSSIERIP